MPYSIKHFPSKGYKVGRADGKKMANGRLYLSNKYLTKKEAQTQMKAVVINEKPKPKTVTKRRKQY